MGNLHFATTKYENNGFEAPKQCSGSGTTYSYDALGRVTSISTVDGNTTYEYNSRAVRITDPYGVQKIVQYDALGRITAVCEVSGSNQQADAPQNCGLDLPGTGYLTTYAYDPASGTTTITQGAQQRILRTDFLGRTTYTKEPESGETTYSYSYNATGLLVTRQKSKANQFDSTIKTTTLTQYDSLGRVVDVSYDDGITPHKSYTYDKSCCWTNAGSATNLKGRLVTISTGNGNPGNSGALFSYDAMGRVVNMWQCGPSNCSAGQTRRVLSFTYDWGSNLTSEQDEASGKIVYDRSPAGEINSITNQTYNDGGNPSNLVSSVANSAFGPTSYHLGNGLNVQMGYDVVGRYIGMYVCTSSSTDCMTNNTDGLQFGGWSSLGANRIYFRCDTVVGSCNNYNYDEFGRMSNSYSYGTLTSTYVYDRYGNRWQQASPQGGPQPNFTFDYSNNRLTTSGFQYDAAGNLVSDGNHSYTYDADGNVLSVDNGGTGQYVYDALNRRIRSQSANGTFEYIYDYAGRRISTWDPSTTNAIEGRIYWGNRLLAYRAWEGPTYFDHQDYLGTERMRTNYAGSTSSTYSSLPFGDGYTPSADDPQGSGQDNLHFAQMEHDSESGTDHAQFRQYSSTQGRWMSPDPYMGSYDFTDPQSFNRYSYVRNNPLVAIDPNGLSGVCISAFPYGSAEPGYEDPLINNSADCASAYGTWEETGSDVTVDVNSDDPIADPGNGAYPVSPSGSSSSTSGSVVTGGNAPNSALSTIQRIYNSGCVGSALKGNAASLSLDALGVALAASPLGPEAKIVGAIALGVTSTVVGATDANSATAKGRLATLGAVANIFGIQTAPLELAQEFAQFSKGAGKVLTGVGVGADLATVGVDIKTCLSQQR